MIVLDATIVNVALPTIHHDLHFSVNNLEWLITAYSLTFGGLLLFGGRTGDLFGKRRMFMIGIAIFAVSSLLGASRQPIYGSSSRGRARASEERLPRRPPSRLSRRTFLKVRSAIARWASTPPWLAPAAP